MRFSREHNHSIQRMGASRDATALINILRLLGNQDAELITTSGAGHRPDGSHNPHSWSIVDERDLTQWLTDRLRAPRPR
jgi:hypothetical protein